MKKTLVDEKLFEYCSSSFQLAVLKHVHETQSYAKSSDELGLTYDAVRGAVRRAKSKAAVQGYAPEHGMTKTAPDTHVVKGTSTLYDQDGNMRMQWVKTDKQRESLAELAEALVESIGDSIVPTSMVPAPVETNENLMNVIPVGDGHIGVYSSGTETGEEYTLQKNVERHRAAVEYLISNAPDAETALIINCGDWVHINDQSNRTPKSGAPLDADGRWHDIVQEARDLLIYMIKAALLTHKKVKLVSALGNHDPSTYLLNMVLDAYFRLEDRVEIETSPSKFHYHQFGKNMIMVTHSDTIKPADAPSIMATDKSQMWGETQYRFAHLGHYHHKQMINLDTKEHRGATVEIHRTLTPQDAWHWASGYRALQECKLITYHKQFGEVQRINVNPAMLR